MLKASFNAQEELLLQNYLEANSDLTIARHRVLHFHICFIFILTDYS